MINKKILLSVFFLSLFLATLNGVVAYSFQIPLCNSTVNVSCINYTSIAPITNAPLNEIIYWRDGYLYLTNDTNITHNNYTNNITYTNISYFYIYNATNGSSITVIQNFTANESIVREWLITKLNSMFHNMTVYNRSEADTTFAFRTELDGVRNSLVNYATVNDLNARYGYLLAINASGINGSINSSDSVNQDIGLVWKIIIIVNCVLIVILLVMLKMVMSG